MENNTQPPAQPAAVPQEPVQQQPVIETPKNEAGKGGSLKLVFIILVIAVVIGAAAYYFFTTQVTTGGNTEDASKTTPVVEEQNITALDNEITAVNLGSDDEGFSDIDQSLQGL